MCCNLNDDLGASLEMIKRKDIEAVVIEASGVTIPIKMANYGQTWPGFYLMGILSVVDGKSLKKLLSNKFVSKTVKAQIEQADKVLLNRFQSKDEELLSTLTKDYLIDGSVENYWELIFKKDSSSISTKNKKYQIHSDFKSSIFTSYKPVNKNHIMNFINNNHCIERAKGWISDEENQTWLIQMSKSACNFNISKYETTTRLVFIHTEDLDLSDLDS